jgi:SAM-dependent methyltransferase
MESSTVEPHPLALNEDSLPLWRRAVTPPLLLAGKLAARGGNVSFDGEQVEYIVGKYNLTPINERCIELGIIKLALAKAAGRGAKVLEVGNVWAHYFDRSFEVVDKFEVAPGVRNADFMDLEENHAYDLVFSISTFEHIGWDDDVREPEKLGAAFAKLRGLLAPGGEALITVPTGWNDWLDEKLVSGETGADTVDWYLRTGQVCSWRNASKEEVETQSYGSPYRNANGLAVLRFKA